ncbi:MAG: hypothetical protein B7733_23170 [Myxococcales bacterium FL481]|nr:MAG: hypothetical protein B7733_23170 [Myxococcales bacterium FL481]
MACAEASRIACTKAEEQASRTIHAAAPGETPPTVYSDHSVYGVRLSAAAGYAGELALTPRRTGQFHFYMGTPQMDMAVIDAGTGVAADYTTEPLACDRFKRVRAYRLSAGTRYTVAFQGGELNTWMRLYIEGGVSACDSEVSPRLDSACDDAAENRSLRAGRTLPVAPALETDRVYVLAFDEADGSGLATFTPLVSGRYHLLLGTPNLHYELETADGACATMPTCRGAISSEDAPCDRFRASHLYELRGGTTYRLRVQPGPWRFARVGLYRRDREPGVVVDFPPDASATSAATVTLRGRAIASDGQPYASVAINGHVVAVEGDGRFRLERELTGRRTQFVVDATDREGDTTTGVAVTTVHQPTVLPERPGGLATVTGSNAWLMTDLASRALLMANPDTGDVQTVSGPEQGDGPAFVRPVGVVYDPVRERAIVADPGASSSAPTQLIAVDLATGSRSVLSGPDRGQGPAFPNRSSVRDDLLFDATRDRILLAAGDLFAVDPISGDRTQLTTFEPPPGIEEAAVGPMTFDPDGEHVFAVANINAVDTVTRRSLVDDAVAPAPGEPAIADPVDERMWAIATDETGDVVYLILGWTLTAFDFSTATSELLYEFAFVPGVDLERVPATGELLFFEGDELLLLDPATKTIKPAVGGGSRVAARVRYAEDIAIDPATGTLYAANLVAGFTPTSTLFEIDLHAATSRSLAVGDWITNVHFDERLYFGNNEPGRLGRGLFTVEPRACEAAPCPVSRLSAARFGDFARGGRRGFAVSSNLDGAIAYRHGRGTQELVSIDLADLESFHVIASRNSGPIPVPDALGAAFEPGRDTTALVLTPDRLLRYALDGSAAAVVHPPAGSPSGLRQATDLAMFGTTALALDDDLHALVAIDTMDGSLTTVSDLADLSSGPTARVTLALAVDPIRRLALILKGSASTSIVGDGLLWVDLETGERVLP